MFNSFYPRRNTMQELQIFMRSFQGDPKAQVEQLLRDGRMTQQQFEQLKQMASQFYGMMGKP